MKNLGKFAYAKSYPNLRFTKNFFSTNLTDPETASVASKRSKTSTKSKSSNADVKLSQSQAGSQAGDEEEQPPPRKTKMIIEQRTRTEIEAYIETILYVSERRVPEEKVSCLLLISHRGTRILGPTVISKDPGPGFQLAQNFLSTSAFLVPWH